jgi:hypothetical protein
MRGRDFFRPPGKAPAAGLTVRERNQSQRHRRKCVICRHPKREAIDDDFLRWRSPKEIVQEYRLAHHSALYRHAHSTGLAARRKASVLTALEYILEQAQSTKPTGDTIVNAVRLYAQLNGQWHEPKRERIVERYSNEEGRPQNESSGNLSSPPAPKPSAVPLQPPAAEFHSPNPNRESGIKT